MPSTHTADFSSAALKAIDLEAVEKVNVGLETDQVRKHVNIVADAPEIRIQDKTGSAPEVNQTTLAIVADGGAAHFRTGTTTFAEGGVETKGDVKFQSSTGDTTHVVIDGASGKLELQEGGLALKLGSNVSVTGSSAVVQEITGPHGRGVVPLRKYPEVVFEEGLFGGNDSTNTYTQGGYTVTASGKYAERFAVWTMFDESEDGEETGGCWIDSDNTTYAKESADAYGGLVGNVLSTVHTTNTLKLASNTPVGAWFTLELPHSVKLEYINMRPRLHDENVSAQSFPREFGIWGYDGDAWVLIKSVTGHASESETGYVKTSVNATTSYKKFGFVITRTNAIGGSNSDDRNFVAIGALKIYGYEDRNTVGDSSVDVALKCAFNAPDSASQSLYIDANETGSSVTDQSGSSLAVTANQVTYDSTDKAWVFTGDATSNIVSADLGFEGDRPHSVSLWFNAANVTSNATLFHVGTESGEGDAKTAISLTETGHLGWIDGGDNQFLTSNTWHNLVYATQGGGGVRTCYLDGRKLGDVYDQDTFGNYPPFDMTGYSQGGYTVSSGSTISNYEAYKAFDNALSLETDAWLGDFDFSSGNPSDTSNGKFGSNGGENDTNGAPGDWIKISLPNRLALSSIGIYPRYASQYEAERLPKSGNVWASNDNTTWVSLLSWTNRTTGTNSVTSWLDSNNESYIVTNATKGYKYFALHWTQTNGWNQAAVGKMKLYGHKENDTTRFPISSTVLKYPHIAMTGPAQRGYVVRVSSIYSYQYDAHYALNEKLSPTNQAYSYWSGADHYTSTGAWDTTYNTDTYKTTASGTDYYGDFIEVEFPRKITLSHITIHPVTTAQNMVNRLPSDGVVAGWNGSSWDAITTYSDFSVSASTHNELDVNASTAYSKIRLVVTALQKNVSLEYEAIAIDILRFYGTEEDLDIVARVGEGLDGKVANFRVYDKYLREEQALELWDAQKDQFERATSSVSVYRGHVGIGTTEPEAALTVMDEAHESEEFPPRAMTANETYMEGYGVFRASASYTFPDSNYGPPAPWKVFSKDTESLSTGWIGSDDHNAVTGSNPGEYNGTNQLASSTPLGEWLKIELPHKIKLNSYALKPWGQSNRFGVADYPKTFYIYGSNDGSSWELIDSRVNTTKTPQILGASVASNETINYSVSQSGLGYYDTYAIVVTKINSEAVYAVDNTVAALYVGLGEWRLFGTRERGQSTLHDGSLTLTKNLTVPRIGPPLDADDTPRRDRLVVEYNTSTNPTENGVVRDTSGRGNDGVFVGTATYDVTEKAFTFPGSGMNTIQKHNLGPNLKGNQPLTVSLWFKTNEDRDQTLFNVLPGDSIETTRKTFGVRTEGDSTNYNLRFYYWNSDYVYNISELHGPQGKWFHLVAMNVGGTKTANGTTYDFGDPSNRRLFLNGVELFTPSSTYSSAVSGTASDLLDLEPNSRLIIGARFKDDGEYPLNGSISNFKLYDVALTADEVKRLYDMGRLGNVIAQPVHIAAPLYAPGVPVQFVSAQVHDKVAYSSAGSIHIDRLDLSIKPHFSNSKIYLMWRIEYEAHHDAVFRIYRDSTLIGYNTVSGEERWSGVTAITYDTSLSSTPEQSMITWIDSPNTTSTVTYKVYQKSSSSASRAFYLNRPLNSAGANDYETGVSQKTAMEIAQ
jgi:hypothetical protein